MTVGQPPRSILPAAPGNGPVRLEGIRKEALEAGRNRLMVTVVLFTLVFMLIGGRLVHLDLIQHRTATWSKSSRHVNTT